MEDIGFINFAKKIRKVNEPREHKIKNSVTWNVHFKYYRKVKPRDKDFVITSQQYLAIIREMNFLMAAKLVEDKQLQLPCGLGTIRIHKNECTNYMDYNGNFRSTKPIDRLSTLKLWYEDEEARNKKIMVRVDTDKTFSIKYNKNKANYKNKNYFQFQFGRTLKNMLRDKLKENPDYDSFCSPKYKYINYVKNKLD